MLLLPLLLPALGMYSDSDCDYWSDCDSSGGSEGAAATMAFLDALQHDGAAGGAPADEGDGECVMGTFVTNAQPLADPSWMAPQPHGWRTAAGLAADHGRGKHARWMQEDALINLPKSHAEQGRLHQARINETGLAGACASKCKFGGKCLDSLSKNEMHACSEHSYGHVMFAEEDSKEFKDQTRAKGDLHNMEEHSRAGRWTCTHKKKESCSTWRELLSSFFTFDKDGAVAERYTVCSKVVCPDAARAAYGISEGSWLKWCAAARKCPGNLQLEVARGEACAEAAQQSRCQTIATSTSEAVGWFQDLLEEFSWLPNETPPTIQHPLEIVWEGFYKVRWECVCPAHARTRAAPAHAPVCCVWQDVYKTEIDGFGTCPSLQQKDGKAPGSWFRARTEALYNISAQEFGLGPDGAPKSLYVLVASANHSNFPQCVKCAHNLEVKLENIRIKAPLQVRLEQRSVQLNHLGDIRAERDLFQSWERQAARDPSVLMQYDDKLGSHWAFWPMYPGNRTSKEHSKRWKYRCTFQELAPPLHHYHPPPQPTATMRGAHHR